MAGESARGVSIAECVCRRSRERRRGNRRRGRVEPVCGDAGSADRIDSRSDVLRSAESHAKGPSLRLCRCCTPDGDRQLARPRSEGDSLIDFDISPAAPQTSSRRPSRAEIITVSFSHRLDGWLGDLNVLCREVCPSRQGAGTSHARAHTNQTGSASRRTQDRLMVELLNFNTGFSPWSFINLTNPEVL
ncbi:uncharacterized protein LOC143478379 [Brachyhypopomus gauderio]|uniref:uncharacterized protein LOC143478379 n=1 Tax=Brachyhypopomus gauderio TaxID=698409 RepID=UPI004041C4E6